MTRRRAPLGCGLMALKSPSPTPRPTPKPHQATLRDRPPIPDWTAR